MAKPKTGARGKAQDTLEKLDESLPRVVEDAIDVLAEKEGLEETNLPANLQDDLARKRAARKVVQDT